MAEPITCNFAQCAIHHFTTKYEGSYHKLPKGLYAKILHDYNELFADTPALKTTYSVVSKKIQTNQCLAESGVQWGQRKNSLLHFVQNNGKALIHWRNPTIPYKSGKCAKGI